MGYADYLRRLLEPLRLYSFADGTVVRSELDAAGAGLDAVSALLDEVYRNSMPPVADEDGLSRYESILPHTPPADLPSRRRAIAALLSTTDCSFTPAALAKSLAACGLAVEVREVDTGTIEVSFPDVAGIPPDFDRITATLDLLLPCHLETVYRFNYMTWERFEFMYPKWAVFDALLASWEQMELSWN